MKINTLVRITTTNGGEIVARLLETYRPTYDAVIGVPNGWVRIWTGRIKTIQQVGA